MKSITSFLIFAGCTSSITPSPSVDFGSDTSTPDSDSESIPGDDTGAGVEDTGDGTDADTTPEEAEDYRLVGAYGVSQATQTVAASCQMETRIFTPDVDTGAPLIVLAHGFARTADQLTGWAEHLASWGFIVATPQLCHSSFWDTDHEVNGEDMLAIADALGASEVIYGGHSAGGLSGLIAGALDVRTVGVIGLDATDADGVGLGYAPLLDAPAIGLLGEPSDCNSDCNGSALYQAATDAIAVRVTDADHCDYESDTDWMCTTFCTNAAASFSDEDIQSTIRGLMTAAAFEITDGQTGWWLSGMYYEALLSEGRLSPL
jgi:hypothetical protein